MIRRVGEVDVEAKMSKGRIYFRANRGQAVWDIGDQVWVSCYREFGYRFKDQITVVFSEVMRLGYYQ